MTAHGILASDRIGPAGAPEVWVLHGILGSARNWRAFTRRLARVRPDLAFRLIDLRHHGDSHGGFPPPDTLAACAEDLARLAEAEGVAPCAVVGHSFGGKVTLAYVARRPAQLAQAWVLDAVPGAVGSFPDDHEVITVVRALHGIAMPVASHDQAADTLRAQGFSDALAAWMTTNLVHRGDGYVWRFDLAAVDRMLRDYAATDLWSVVDDPPVPLHVVRAGRGDRWEADAVARLGRSAAVDHLLADSGHWVHVDAPDTLRELLALHLPGGDAA